jgi:hypothetical protein
MGSGALIRATDTTQRPNARIRKAFPKDWGALNQPVCSRGQSKYPEDIITTPQTGSKFTPSSVRREDGIAAKTDRFELLYN